MAFRDPNRLEDVHCCVGEVVSLRSGGPNMTIGSVEVDQIACVWFGKADRPISRVFFRAMLQPGSARHVMLVPVPSDGRRSGPPPLPREVGERETKVNIK